MAIDKLAWLKNVIRRASYRWPPRYEAKTLARIRRGVYRCGICQGEVPASELEMDHIEPVIDPKKGWVSLEDYGMKMIPDAEGFQAVHKTCHLAKSIEENSQRRETKKTIDKKKKKE